MSRCLPCPCCSDTLEEISAGPCLVDLCRACGGVWLDHGELRRLADERPVLPAALDTPSAECEPSDRKPRPCPRCLLTLNRFHPGGKETLHAERCFRCGGIWLDGGELQAAVKLARPDRPGPAPPPRSGISGAPAAAAPFSRESPGSRAYATAESAGFIAEVLFHLADVLPFV